MCKCKQCPVPQMNSKIVSQMIGSASKKRKLHSIKIPFPLVQATSKNYRRTASKEGAQLSRTKHSPYSTHLGIPQHLSLCWSIMWFQLVLPSHISIFGYPEIKSCRAQHELSPSINSCMEIAVYDFICNSFIWVWNYWLPNRCTAPENCFNICHAYLPIKSATYRVVNCPNQRNFLDIWISINWTTFSLLLVIRHHSITDRIKNTQTFIIHLNNLWAWSHVYFGTNLFFF